MGGFWPNLHRHIIGTGERSDLIWWPWPHFQGHTHTLNVKFVGVHVRVASCLHFIFWTSGWILTKLTQTHYWDGGKKWLDFGDLDLIFKVTPALWNFYHKKLVCTLMTDSGQIVTGWVKDLIRFWWPWPNFQGHHTIKTVKMSLVCTLSPETNGGFWPNYTETPLEHGKEMMSNFDPKKLVCTQWWILAKHYVLYHWDN